jgi:hypothetical protein
MTDKHITVDSIRWHSVLPWLHLLRAAQLALRVRVVLLALCAVVVFGSVGMAIRMLPFHSSYGQNSTIVGVLEEPIESPFGLADRISDWPQNHRQGWLVWPWNTVMTPGAKLFWKGTRPWSGVATAWTDLLWALLMWAVFGGAITRIHAVRFARNESVSPLTAARFSSRNWQSYVYGPLLPMLGVGGLTLFGVLVGQVSGWFGDARGSALLYLGWLPLLASFMMTALLLLTVLAWPLMVAAISVEGSDGFDGLSRAFGYVMNRPWYFLFLLCLALGIGVLTSHFAWWFLGFAFHLAEWSTGGDQGVRGLIRPFDIWQIGLKLLHLAVLVSYFWSATTVIYFLLRQSDDGTPLDQVYIPGPPPKPEPLPLVGVAASQQPVIERPATEANQAAPPSA